MMKFLTNQAAKLDRLLRQTLNVYIIQSFTGIRRRVFEIVFVYGRTGG